MGWSGGTEVFQSVWNSVRGYIPESERPIAAAQVINALTDQDWDCVDEVVDSWPEMRQALLIYDPEFFDYESEEEEMEANV